MTDATASNPDVSSEELQPKVLTPPGPESLAAQIAQYGTGTVILGVGLTLLFGTLTGLYTHSPAEFICTVIISTVLVTAGAAINLYGYKRNCDFAAIKLMHYNALEEKYIEAAKAAGTLGAGVTIPRFA
jgi:hypothetical protein